MLGPLSFVAVRQEHGQTAEPSPLGLARGNELVDDDLRTIDEIAELRLPNNQIIGTGGRKPVFEAHHGFLRQHRIDDGKARLSVANVLQRDVAPSACLIVQYRMSVEKSAAPGVLARYANRVAFLQQ